MLMRVRNYIQEVKGIGKSKMTSKDASRIQSATAKSSRGKVSKNSFASRAQRAASKSSR